MLYEKYFADKCNILPSIVTIIKDILQLDVKFLVLGTDFQEYDFNIVHSSVSSWLTKKLRQIVLRQKKQ